MRKIRTKDEVILPDGAVATALEVIVIEQSKVCKVRRTDTGSIEFCDMNNLQLKKKHFLNLLIPFG